MPNVSSERLEEKNNFFSSDFSRDSIARGCSQAAAAAAAAAAGSAASLQNASLATPKHPATERQNDLQKHAAPRLNVPSGLW